MHIIFKLNSAVLSEDEEGGSLGGGRGVAGPNSLWALRQRE